MKSNGEHLAEALTLVKSEKGEVFAQQLEAAVEDALIKTKGEKLGVVESAVVLTDEEKRKIQTVLERIIQRKLEIQFATFPKLLGGFKITIGDWKLDATILNQLEMLKEQVTGGNKS
ncbi:F0F1 ATP synthase subunit delta [Candidatus Gottesmanbacteria bacterium]|nr:F0F1 ATP synthase subunit delta [Candidatus Gottesmanbacteria bacterium]